MPLLLHDTLTREARPLEPQTPGDPVRLYHCGPTVYGRQSIGNFRSFLFADLLRRRLEAAGLDVLQVMNITDVGHLTIDDRDEGEDKMEKAAREEGLDPWKIAERYTEMFFSDLDRLMVRRAHHYPRATDHIAEMIEVIEALIAKDLAYEIEGEVYFSVHAFPGYGRLSGNRLEDLEAGARVAVNTAKRDPRDFLLWKRDDKHLMQWDSPWGRGFPGWHVECSAMSVKYLGEAIDLHTGGEDNIFPHHDCEIAQSDGAFGHPVVAQWAHVRFLQVDGGKMSKSLGNVYSLDDVEERGFTMRELRFALIRTHYRQELNFTWGAMEDSHAALERLQGSLRRLDEAAGSDDAAPLVESARSAWNAALDDDLNVAEALGALFTLVGEVNKTDLSAAGAEAVRAFLAEADEVLGVLDWEVESGDEEIDALVAARDDARAAKDWAESDRLRDELAARGIVLEDTAAGARWHRSR